MSQYIEVLAYIRRGAVSLKSNYARYEAYLIAEAASRGHITSILGGRAWGGWYITEEGIKFLKQYKGDYVYH